MKFIESSKTKILRLVGNWLIVAVNFLIVIVIGGSFFLFMVTAMLFKNYSGQEIVDALSILIVSIPLFLIFVIAPLIILIFGVIGLFQKNFAINMLTGVFSILYGLLLCLFFVMSYLIIIPLIQIIGGILTVIAAVNLNREKTLYEANVLGYQQPSTIYPQPGIRQPFPTPQPPMSQPTPMPQRPMVNNQPQQPFFQPVVYQPNNNIGNNHEQWSQPTPMSQPNPMKQPTPMPQRPMVNNQPQQPVSQPVVNQPNNNVDNSQEQ